MTNAATTEGAEVFGTTDYTEGTEVIGTTEDTEDTEYTEFMKGIYKNWGIGHRALRYIGCIGYIKYIGVGGAKHLCI